MLYGKYRGEVVDAKDEEKRGRVLITVPSLGDVQLGWAECCLPPGIYSVPQRGDFVWVEFEEGNIDKPIWVGIMPTKDYYKDLVGSNTEKDVVIKSGGKFSMESKTSTTVKSAGAVNVTGSSLNNSSKWSIDDIGRQ